MSAATPEDIANVCKLLERLRTGELNLIPGDHAPKPDASTALLVRVEELLAAQLRRMQAPLGDGGAAFPVMPPLDPRGGSAPGYPYPESGASLRDYFAGKAMQAEMITTFSDATPESAEQFVNAAAAANRSVEEHLAFNAYLIADAMLKVRQA